MANMNSNQQFLKNIYEAFNKREIEAIISFMDPDVKWANGMEGGHVYGHNGVKEYWTRQFTMVSSNVSPLEINKEDGTVKVKVHQVVHDLNGNLLADEIVYHFFLLQDNKVALFDIGEKAETGES